MINLFGEEVIEKEISFEVLTRQLKEYREELGRKKYTIQRQREEIEKLENKLEKLRRFEELEMEYKAFQEAKEAVFENMWSYDPEYVGMLLKEIFEKNEISNDDKDTLEKIFLKLYPRDLAFMNKELEEKCSILESKVYELEKDNESLENDLNYYR
ncbi:hypothetical protein [Fusobacterium ulcerans]|uniref:hypothetical protein n=1 Tax=Fusobacterium ulcerans TaxID=861 RepID=UPI0027B901B9|nr:hypothetical protein [Fusobacterium ulcerans]